MRLSEVYEQHSGGIATEDTPVGRRLSEVMQEHTPATAEPPPVQIDPQTQSILNQEAGGLAGQLAAKAGNPEAQAGVVPLPITEQVHHPAIYEDLGRSSGNRLVSATAWGSQEAMAGLTGRLKGISDALDKYFGVQRKNPNAYTDLNKYFTKNADYWDKILQDEGASGVDRAVGAAVGGLGPGMLEWMGNVPLAAATGAAEASVKGESAIKGAAKEGAKRFLLGKLLDYYSYIKNPVVRRTLGAATFSVPSLVEGQPATEVASQAVLGGVMTGGRPERAKQLSDIQQQAKAATPEVAVVSPARTSATPPLPPVEATLPTATAKTPTVEAIAKPEVQKILNNGKMKFSQKADALKAMRQRGELTTGELGAAVMSIPSELAESTSTAKTGKENPLQKLVDEYDNSTNMTESELIEKVDKITNDPEIETAIHRLRKSEEEDKAEFGLRGDSSNEEEAVVELIRRRAQPSPPAKEAQVAQTAKGEKQATEKKAARGLGEPYLTDGKSFVRADSVSYRNKAKYPYSVGRALSAQHAKLIWSEDVEVRTALAQPEKAGEGIKAVFDPSKVPIVELDPSKLKLSKDVPNFKRAASDETGEVLGNELQGEYSQLPKNPITVWERKNGDLEVISGRHRWQLAIRNGVKVPSQIVKESEGFTKEMALTLDAEANIKDGQGDVKDYAQYFRNTKIEEDTPRARSLLSRPKSKVGYVIGKSAVDDVYSALLGGKLSEAKAAAIARGAPNNDPVQHAALAKVDRMSADDLEQFARILSRTKPSDNFKATQGNLFGFDDSALLEAEAIAKEVGKETTSIKERIVAVRGALRKPDVARKMGLEFSDEASIRKEVQRLEERLGDLSRVDTTPALWQEMKKRVGLSPEPEIAVAPPEEIKPQNTKEVEQIYADSVPPTDVPIKVKLQDAVKQAIDEDLSRALEAKKAKRKYKLIKNEQELYDKEFSDTPELFINPKDPIPEMRAAWTIRFKGKGLFGGTTELSREQQRRKGADRLTPLIVEETISNVKTAAIGVRQVAKNVPKIAKFYTGRAAAVIEKTYGEPGKELAKDIREIAFQSDRHFEKQWQEMRKILDKLSRNERLEIAKIGLGRLDPKINPKLEKVNNQLLELMDKDMSAADLAGFKRLLGGEWHNLKGSGKWYPQSLNAEGQLRMKEMAQAGLGNPHIKALAEEMVAKEQAKTEEEALAKMMDWNNSRTRGTHGYFERPRTWSPPEKWLELDPEKTLPGLLEKNASLVEAAKVWGVESAEESTVQFVRAKSLIAKIQQQYGSADAESLKKWVRTNFGLSNDIPNFVTDTINILNHYETVARLGFRIPSALRNLTQGDVNLFTAPLSAHLKANAIVIFRRWSRVAEQLYQEAKLSGAVKGQKELAEVERGPTGEPQTPKASMAMFGAAEESNHIRAALIGRFSAEKQIQDLAAMKEGGTLKKILEHIKYLSINPERYLTERIKNKTFTNQITDAEVDKLWKGEKLTLDDYERIMHRASVDTQFQQNLATRSIPWRTNPFLRLGLKFKTFGVNQMRLLYEDAVKEAAKGTFAPLGKYILFSVLAGELWNLTRDAIVGGDQSLTSTMINRPEQRNLKTVAYKLANDFFDGAGVGILSDMAYGVGNFLLGPVGQTGKNITEWASNLKHPWTATQKLVKKELAVSRDIEGLTARADKLFFNHNNRFFEYKRWRDRSFEWQDQQKNPTAIQQIGRGAKEALIGRPKYSTILPYEYAARQITLGDVDDAADYLADQIRNDNRDKKEILNSVKSSMRNYSPMGHISKEDGGEFLSQFTLKDRQEGVRIQKEWIADYNKAIYEAFKKANKPKPTPNSPTKSRRPKLRP